MFEVIWFTQCTYVYTTMSAGQLHEMFNMHHMLDCRLSMRHMVDSVFALMQLSTVNDARVQVAQIRKIS